MDKLRKDILRFLPKLYFYYNHVFLQPWISLDLCLPGGDARCLGPFYWRCSQVLVATGVMESSCSPRGHDPIWIILSITKIIEMGWYHQLTSLKLKVNHIGAAGRNEVWVVSTDQRYNEWFPLPKVSWFPGSLGNAWCSSVVQFKLHLPKVQVHVFGSTATSLNLPTADIDIAIVTLDFTVVTKKHREEMRSWD